MSRAPAWLTASGARHRAVLVIAVISVLGSSGTAAAVSYLVLGTTNTSGATTTLKSGVNGPVLKLTNTNTAGTNTRGLAITVPAGRPPITVNATAGKATNLDADKLDGLDSTKLAHGTNVDVLSNRLVLASGTGDVVLLTLPRLGTLKGWCPSGPESSSASVQWINTTSAPIDTWSNGYADNRMHGSIKAAGDGWNAAEWDVFNGYQTGDTLILGQGNDPGARRTATITAAAYRSATGAPCGLQATATIWSTP